MSRFEYAKDVRTWDKFRADFELGKKMQRAVIEYLSIYRGWSIVDLSLNEVFGEDIKDYEPDFKAFVDGVEIYVEFKFVNFDIEYSWLKTNQAKKLSQYKNGYYMQVKKCKNGLYMYNFLHIKEVLKNEIKIGYGGKEIYEIKNSNWKLFTYKLMV